ncbi:hypothetical protein D3C85_1539830 [compost metagenome]
MYVASFQKALLNFSAEGGVTRQFLLDLGQVACQLLLHVVQQVSCTCQVFADFDIRVCCQVPLYARQDRVAPSHQAFADIVVLITHQPLEDAFGKVTVARQRLAYLGIRIC